MHWSARDLTLAREALAALQADAAWRSEPPPDAALAERLARSEPGWIELTGEQLGVVWRALAFASSTDEHAHGMHACIHDEAYLGRMMSPEVQAANAAIDARSAL